MKLTRWSSDRCSTFVFRALYHIATFTPTFRLATIVQRKRWGSGKSSLLQSNQNQFEFLVGFSR